MRSVLALLFFGVPLASAQTDAEVPIYPIESGTRLLGGGASLIRLDGGFAANLSPRVGRFVGDGLALSTSASVTYQRSTFTTVGIGPGGELVEQDATQRSVSLGLGPEVTYYVGGAARAAYPFVSANAQLQYYDSEATGFSEFALSRFDLSAQLSGGVMLPVARNVGLQAEAFYQANGLTRDVERSDYYGLSVGFTTFIY